jgi:mannose-6-phosphate isomerase-like protein (cupin superfamily)
MDLLKQKPQVVQENDIQTVGPGYDDHWITVPIKTFYDVEDVLNIGVSFVDPGSKTCVFSLEQEDDGTALHYYGPVDEFYYILEGEFTVYWGTDADDLEDSYELRPGDCAYYPTGWKYQVENTGDKAGKFLFVMTNKSDIKIRMDNA